MRTNVLSKPEESRDRLAELGGLDALIFAQAIQRGQAIAAGFTLNHPAICRGISQWGEVVAAIREQLLPQGWTRMDEDNLPLTVNPTRTIAISVSTGDENTGIADAKPSTRSTKGPRTADAVVVNALQLELFGNVPLKPEELKESNGVMTWILLFHRDVTAQETRFELSRPVKMDSDGHVDVWVERIIFPALPFGTDGVLAPEDLPLSPEIVPEVKRKRA
jgi:hypothetical protein